MLTVYTRFASAKMADGNLIGGRGGGDDDS